MWNFIKIHPVQVTLSDVGGQTNTHDKAKKLFFCKWFANALSTVPSFVKDTQMNKEEHWHHQSGDAAQARHNKNKVTITSIYSRDEIHFKVNKENK